jgi:hypothetical protein
VLVVQGRLKDAQNAYQQGLAIAKSLAEQDKSNSGPQLDLVVSLYKVGAIAARIGDNDDLSQAQEFFKEALKVADRYSGPERQRLVDALNQALQALLHSR